MCECRELRRFLAQRCSLPESSDIRTQARKTSQALLFTCRLGNLQQRHNAYVSVSSWVFPRSAPSSCFLTSLSCMWSRTLHSGEKPQGLSKPSGASTHSRRELPWRERSQFAAPLWLACLLLTAPILQRNLRHMSSKHPCSKVAAGLSRNVSGLDVAHLRTKHPPPGVFRGFPVTTRTE